MTVISMPIRSRILAPVVAAVLMAPLMALASSPPASAAGYPWCNDTIVQYHGHWRMTIPYRRSALGSTLNCRLDARSGSTSSKDWPGVRRLQRTLNQCYGASLVVDGRFGPLTEFELVSIQAWEDIEPDGIYGPQTRKALRWWGYNRYINQWGCHRHGL